ncbi:MAG TPA: HNH endonuclease signature motif containing protein [Caldilineaceae bacterium]|nr:HNH endonuclease signature motif containing protein [Caldilineaceae bacterium]
MPRAYIPVAIRRSVIERAYERCEYCQARADFATETFAVEHIVPVSRGGTDDLENLALACSGCNSRKYNKVEATDPTSGDTVPLFNPRSQVWAEHFRWNEDYTQILD